MKPLLDTVPPDIFSDDPGGARRDSPRIAARFRKLDRKVLHDAVRLLTGSAADFLDDYFESDILKGYLASSAIIGTKVGPYSQGSGLVLLYHILGEHDGEMGAWSFHKRGNGGFTKVLARAAESFGVEIRLESPVDHVITQQRPGDRRRADRRDRVPRADRGQRARPAPDVPRAGRAARAADRPRRERSSGSASRARRPRSTSRSTASPKYPALGDRTDQYRGFTNIGPSMEYLERAYDDAKYGWYSKRPYLDTRDPVDGRSGHGAARQGRHELLRPVRAVPPPRERLGHREGEPRRHGPANARVVLPGLRRPGPPARGPDAARHRADGRAVGGQHLRRRVPRPADVLLPACTGLVAVPDPDRRLLPVRLGHPSRAAASWAPRASSPPARSSRTASGPRPDLERSRSSAELREPDGCMSG